MAQSKMEKHALFISQYFPPDPGGSTTRAYNAARGLIMNGCKVTVVTAFPHYPDGKIPSTYKDKIVSIEKMDGIQLIRTYIPSIPHSSNLKRLFLHSTFILSSLLGLLYVRKVDVIFAMNPNFFSFFPSMIYSWIHRKKIVKAADDLWPEVFYELGFVRSKILRSLLDRISRYSYRVSGAVISVSEEYVSIITEKYKIDPSKVHLIEHGVDVSMFRPLGKKSDRFNIVVMYSGAINVGYDFDLILKVAAIVEKKPIRFIIRGRGDYVDKVNSLVAEYNLRNVDVVTDILSKEEVIDVLNEADIFILPMSPVQVIDRGLPTKLLEYQSLAKPIICISDGESGKYITRTRSGLVTRSRDPNVVASLLLRLIDDKLLREELGHNGFMYIQENLTLNKIGERILQVINQSR